MVDSEEHEDAVSNSSEDEEASEVDLEKACFICLKVGDPIVNKLKNVTGNVLSKCVLAIDTRNKLPSGTKKTLDISNIKLPENLQQNRKYHQNCFRNLTNVSGKKQRTETLQSAEVVDDIQAEEVPDPDDIEADQDYFGEER